MKKAVKPQTVEPSAFDIKLFRKQITDHVKSAGGTALVGGQDFIQGLVKTAIEALLEVEMDEHLGYDKHDPDGHGSGNSRNGVDAKTIRGDFGQVSIQTPRDRNASFEPQIVKKRSGNVGNFADKVVSLYARGMTTREIQDHLKDMYGIDASAEFVSRATARVQQEIVDWQNRPLEAIYPVVYVDGMFMNIRDSEGSGKVHRRCLHTAPTIEAASLALDRMEERWGKKYAYAIASWRTHWNLLTTFFRYPPELRTFIYTTNAIESLHSRMRKNTDNRRFSGVRPKISSRPAAWCKRLPGVDRPKRPGGKTMSLSQSPKGLGPLPDPPGLAH